MQRKKWLSSGLGQVKEGAKQACQNSGVSRRGMGSVVKSAGGIRHPLESTPDFGGRYSRGRNAGEYF